MSTQNYEVKTSTTAEIFKTLAGAGLSAGAVYGLLKYADNVVKVFVVGTYPLNATMIVAAGGYGVAKIVELAVSRFTNEAIASIVGVVAQGGIYVALVLKYPVIPFVLSASPIAPLVVATVFIGFKFLELGSKNSSNEQILARVPKDLEDAQMEGYMSQNSQIKIVKQKWVEKLTVFSNKTIKEKDHIIRQFREMLMNKDQQILLLKKELNSKKGKCKLIDNFSIDIPKDEKELLSEIHKLKFEAQEHNKKIRTLTKEKEELTTAENEATILATKREEEFNIILKEKIVEVSELLKQQKLIDNTLNEKNLELENTKRLLFENKEKLLSENQENEEKKDNFHKYESLAKDYNQLLEVKKQLEQEKLELTKQKNLANEKVIEKETLIQHQNKEIKEANEVKDNALLDLIKANEEVKKANEEVKKVNEELSKVNFILLDKTDLTLNVNQTHQKLDENSKKLVPKEDQLKENVNSVEGEGQGEGQGEGIGEGEGEGKGEGCLQQNNQPHEIQLLQNELGPINQPEKVENVNN